MGSICASLHAQGKLPRACQGVSAAALRTNPAPWLPVPSAPTLDILSRASLFLCTHSLSPAMVAPCMLALWTLFAAISSVVSENVAPVPVFRLGSGAVAPSSPAYDYKAKNQPAPARWTTTCSTCTDVLHTITCNHRFGYDGARKPLELLRRRRIARLQLQDSPFVVSRERAQL